PDAAHGPVGNDEVHLQKLVPVQQTVQGVRHFHIDALTGQPFLQHVSHFLRMVPRPSSLKDQRLFHVDAPPLILMATDRSQGHGGYTPFTANTSAKGMNRAELANHPAVICTLPFPLPMPGYMLKFLINSLYIVSIFPASGQLFP